jgi:hypothetical protein
LALARERCQAQSIQSYPYLDISYSVLQRSVPPLRGDTAVFIYFISLFHSADGMHWQIFPFGRVRLAQQSGAPGVGQANRPDLATDTKRVSLIQHVCLRLTMYLTSSSPVKHPSPTQAGSRITVQDNYPCSSAACAPRADWMFHTLHSVKTWTRYLLAPSLSLSYDVESLTASMSPRPTQPPGPGAWWGRRYFLPAGMPAVNVMIECNSSFRS